MAQEPPGGSLNWPSSVPEGPFFIPRSVAESSTANTEYGFRAPATIPGPPTIGDLPLDAARVYEGAAYPPTSGAFRSVPTAAASVSDSFQSFEAVSPGGRHLLDPSRVTEGGMPMPSMGRTLEPVIVADAFPTFEPVSPGGNYRVTEFAAPMPSMGRTWEPAPVLPVSYAPAPAGEHSLDPGRVTEERGFFWESRAEPVPPPPMDRSVTLDYSALSTAPRAPPPPPPPSAPRQPPRAEEVPQPPMEHTAVPAIRAPSRVLQREGAGRNGLPASSMKKLPAILRDLRDLAMKYVRIVCICLILSFGAAGLPILGALELLSDRNYTFWMGIRYPLLVIFGCIGVTVLMVITILLLIKHATNYIRGKITFMILQSIFASLLGVVLVYLWVAQTRNLNQTADRISLGCMNSMPEASILADYGTVLYNLRLQPDCINRTSVELCDGWAENEYTSYLRYLEFEFKCGPMCRDLQLPAGAVQAVKLLQEGMTADPHFHAHNEVWLQESEEAGTALAPIQAVRLFSQGYTRMSCAPLVSTRLRVLAFCFSDLMFHQGFMLIMCAIIMSALAIAQVTFGEGAKKASSAAAALITNERTPIVQSGQAPRENPRYFA